MRDVHTDDARTAGRRRESQIAGAGREIEDAQTGARRRERDDAPFPAPILSVRQRHRNEVVTVRDRGKQRTDVSTFAIGCRDALVQGSSHQSSVVSRQD